MESRVRVAVVISLTCLISLLMLIAAVFGYIFFNADGVIVAKYHEHETTEIQYIYNEATEEIEEQIVYTPETHIFIVDVGIGYRRIEVNEDEWEHHQAGDTIETKAHSIHNNPAGIID